MNAKIIDVISIEKIKIVNYAGTNLLRSLLKYSLLFKTMFYNLHFINMFISHQETTNNFNRFFFFC